MKKSYRIRKNEEFSSIIEKKKTFNSSCFLLYVDDKKMDYSRVGISVSKKLGNAVVRNKIKRQVRMMFLNIFDFNTNNIDIICIVKPKYLENSFSFNQEQLEKVVKKAIINKYK